MLRRALLTVAVLSYLICVLLLSGVQKEDLDVNTLRKLQRRNVNIHDVNNEEIREECQLNNTDSRMKAEKILNVLLSSKSEQLPMEEYHKDSLIDFSLQNSTNRLYEDSDPKSTYNESIMTRGRRTVTTERNFVETTTLLINNHSYKEIDEGKKTLENVINFWQNLGKRNKKGRAESSIVEVSSDTNILKTTKTRKSTPEKTQIEIKLNSVGSIDNDFEKTNIVAGGYLNNMLSEYVLNQRTSLHTSSTTRKSLDLDIVDFVTDDDTDIFKYLLNTSDKKSSETHNINAHLSKYSYEFNFSKSKYPNKKFKYNKHRSFKDEEELNKIFPRDFEDLKSISEFVSDKPSTVQYLKSIFEKYDKYGKKKSKDNQSKVMSYNELPTTTLPSEVIKQIAENVRALVLKDLKKDKGKANATDLLIATKGTTKTPTQVTKKKLETSYVIEKIMEILQKYKTENDGNVTYTTETNNKRNLFRRTTKVVYPPLLPPIDNYAMKPPNYPPYTNNLYKPTESTKKAIRLRLSNPKQKPFNPIRKLPPAVKSVDTVNIYKTIQTNLNEIPPLGIPVSNPMSLVSQNIIVTTRRPFHKKNTTRKYKFQSNKNTVLKKTSQNRKKSFATDVNQNDDDYDKKNVIKFRIRDNSDEVNTDYYENVRIKNYESGLNSPYRYRLRSRDNVQRFHEKLERFQANANNEDADREDCKDEIFAREQRPLNDVNRRDDTPFKNLLRTQQKVTDMLEKILARTKAEQPLSVETT